jgi:hypothetical protein
MRTRASLAAVVAACAWAAGAAAGGPGDVYNDYAQDGRLSCNHSHAELEAVLRSGSLNQYGDPLTLARLKLAVRKQLAGGCRHGRSGPGANETGGAGTPSGGGTSGGQTPRSSKGSPARHARGSKTAAPSQPESRRAASTGSDSAWFFAGRGLIVGVLVAALALGGWLTKHALAARD